MAPTMWSCVIWSEWKWHASKSFQQVFVAVHTWIFNLLMICPLLYAVPFIAWVVNQLAPVSMAMYSETYELNHSAIIHVGVISLDHKIQCFLTQRPRSQSPKSKLWVRSCVPNALSHLCTSPGTSVAESGTKYKKNSITCPFRAQIAWYIVINLKNMKSNCFPGGFRISGKVVAWQATKLHHCWVQLKFKYQRRMPTSIAFKREGGKPSFF